jgi:hypothetical protein
MFCAAVAFAMPATGATAQSSDPASSYVGPLIFPLHYPPGARGHGLAPVGYSLLPNGHYRAEVASNRFRLILPPIRGRFTIRCRLAAGATRPFGNAWWQFSPTGQHLPGTGSVGGGIGVDTPPEGGVLTFSVAIPLHSGAGPDSIESVWIVAPIGTEFVSCEVDRPRPSTRNRVPG